MREHVFGQIVSYGESTIALAAKVILLLCMHGHMDFEFALRSEFAFAHLAREFVHSFVALFVNVEGRIGGEFLLAQCALEHFLHIFQMNAAYVIGDDAFATEKCTANIAFVVFDFLVEVIDVIAQTTVVGKGLVAFGAIGGTFRFWQMILFAAAVIVRCGFVRSFCCFLRWWNCVVVCCTCGRRTNSSSSSGGISDSRCIVGLCFFGCI